MTQAPPNRHPHHTNAATTRPRFAAHTLANAGTFRRLHWTRSTIPNTRRTQERRFGGECPSNGCERSPGLKSVAVGARRLWLLCRSFGRTKSDCRCTAIRARPGRWSGLVSNRIGSLRMAVDIHTRDRSGSVAGRGVPPQHRQCRHRPVAPTRTQRHGAPRRRGRRGLRVPPPVLHRLERFFVRLAPPIGLSGYVRPRVTVAL